MDDQPRHVRIRTINDLSRRTFTGATIVTTAAFAELPNELKAKALERVRTFDAFDADNDPHHEHDMAIFEEGGKSFFFKFDYYDQTMRCGSDDPTDTGKTRRVLTIGLASDC
jgi:Protein of unknown function (DUF3768)